jgi:hyperosmotically inducible periplasmic protein
MNCRLKRCFVVLAIVGLVSLGCSHPAPQPENSGSAGNALHDASITAAVKLSLAFEPGVAAIGVNVDTNGGVVTLRGEVGSESERQLATKVAEDVGGVTEVVNELRVRG